MPKKYKLRYLPLFWSDLQGAALYICNVLSNPEAATRLVERTEEAIYKRLNSPTMEQRVETSQKRELPYYWFAVGNYMVFYVVYDDVMEVRRFIYGARDLNGLLL